MNAADIVSSSWEPLTVTEVAARLRVHPHTVKRIPPAELPYFCVGHRGDRRYLVEDLRAFVSARRIDR